MHLRGHGVLVLSLHRKPTSWRATRASPVSQADRQEEHVWKREYQRPSVEHGELRFADSQAVVVSVPWIPQKPAQCLTTLFLFSSNCHTFHFYPTQAGRLYEKENEERLKDQLDFGKTAPDSLPLGCRELVKENFSKVRQEECSCGTRATAEAQHLPPPHIPQKHNT